MMATARIANEHGSFNRICQVAPTILYESASRDGISIGSASFCRAHNHDHNTDTQIDETMW